MAAVLTRTCSCVLVLVVLQGLSCATSSSEFLGRELFGTKTPYLWTRQDMDTSDLSSVQYKGQTCSAVYVDGIYRHGARYPSLKWIHRMDNLRTLLSTESGIDQFVVDWVNAFTADKETQLSALGKQEMVVLGERLGSRFQTFLNSRTDMIKFFSSTKDRSKDSATYFQEGLGNKFGTNVSLPIALDNLMLRFYDSCKLYEQLMDNDKTFEEYDKFLSGPEMTDAVSYVNRAVLNGHFNLSFDQVKIMQQICAFELAFFNTSDWCRYFRLSELDVMDYAEDIEMNIEGGYRHKITAQMSCPLLKHVFQQMDKAARNKTDRPLASIRIGHVVSVSSVYAALGLFNGSHILLATDYLANAGRPFRFSVVLPFSSNLVTIMYKCGSEYWVKMMVNGEEMTIPACGDVMCPYTVFREHYKQFVNCDFDGICGNVISGAVTKSASFATACIGLLLVIIFK
ncbi:multiple inositol polyphosphate phosphatase 1-like [Argopecten irradians]|uniref:multiple inositol polyphosphate phosphatase 1-like n=1 Tax=Argopecten irradians TaxID=31199 RepID=UPI003718C7B8